MIETGERELTYRLQASLGLEGRHSHPYIRQSGWTDRTPSPGENLGYLTARFLGVLPVGASAASHDAAVETRPADRGRGRP